MDTKTAIGYAVYCPGKDMFLGRDGAWYSDVRMATVYHSPQPAKLASKRIKATFHRAVVEVRLTVLPQSIEMAAEAKPAEPAPTPAAPTAPPTVDQPKPAGTQAKKAA